MLSVCWLFFFFCPPRGLVLSSFVNGIFLGRFFGFYKDIGAVLYPVLSDVAEFERNLHRLLRNRAQAGGGYRPDANGLVKPFGMSLGFLSLLFAILASGCQLSDLPTSERELTSWVYGLWSFLSVCLCLVFMKAYCLFQVSCSYQCLRMMNYVAQPTVEVIQILLIISNVLSYNMNAGASYTLLGEFSSSLHPFCVPMGKKKKKKN